MEKITESTSPNYNGPEDSDNDFMCATQLQRIADALELVIQMVKKDQEETRARFEERWDKEDTTEKWEPGTCK